MISRCFIFFAIWHGWSYFGLTLNAVKDWISERLKRKKSRSTWHVLSMVTDPYDYSISPHLLRSFLANIIIDLPPRKKKLKLRGIIAFIFCSYFRRLSRCRGPIHLGEGKKKKLPSIVRLSWLRRKTQISGIYCFRLCTTPRNTRCLETS